MLLFYHVGENDCVLRKSFASQSASFELEPLLMYLLHPLLFLKINNLKNKWKNK